MYDVDLLEQQWKLYHAKRNRPKYIIAVASVFLVTAGILLYSNKDRIIIFDLNQTTPQVVQQVVKSELKLPEVNQTIVPVETISQKPLLKIEVEKPYDQAGNVPVLEDVESLSADTLTKEEESIGEHHKVKLNIEVVDASDVTGYHVIEKRFYENGDIDDALFLARNYFDKKNYSKSEYWALQANKSDEMNEEAWVLFAKSKYQLGNKGEAITVLRSYLEKRDSSQAREVLQKFISR